MSMEKSNRQQTIQMAIFVIGLLTIGAILFALTACGPQPKQPKLTASESKFIAELDPIMHDKLRTPPQITVMVDLGKSVCTSQSRGLSVDDIITIIDEQFTTTESNAIYSAANTNLCEK